MDGFSRAFPTQICRLSAWLAAWLAQFCDVFVWLFHFERVLTWLSDADLCFSQAVYLISGGKIDALAGWLEQYFHIAFQGKSVGCLAGWLPGWLAGRVAG